MKDIRIETIKYAVILLLGAITSTDRKEVFSEFCIHCGGLVIPCNCMKDD